MAKDTEQAPIPLNFGPRTNNILKAPEMEPFYLYLFLDVNLISSIQLLNLKYK
jgi:hypothetical protein